MGTRDDTQLEKRTSSGNLFHLLFIIILCIIIMYCDIPHDTTTTSTTFSKQSGRIYIYFLIPTSNQFFTLIL